MESIKDHNLKQSNCRAPGDPGQPAVLGPVKVGPPGRPGPAAAPRHGGPGPRALLGPARALPPALRRRGRRLRGRGGAGARRHQAALLRQLDRLQPDHTGQPRPRAQAPDSHAVSQAPGEIFRMTAIGFQIPETRVQTELIC